MTGYERAHAHLADGPAIWFRRVFDVSVLLRLKVSVERARNNIHFCQPFYRCNRVPAGNHDTNRESVIWCQWLTIHAIRDEHGMLNRGRDGKAAFKVNNASRPYCTGVSAAKNNFNCIRTNAALSEQ